MKNKFKNKNVLIMGMGKSGQSSLQLLNKLDAFCYIYDKDVEKLKEIQYRDANIITNISEEIIKVMDYIIISPGVSIYDEHIKLAKLFGVEVISELELGCMFAKGNLIGITGTNGKTTTCSLVHHILKNSNKLSMLCGNIGEPLTENLLPFNSNYVVEMSSFQLESLQKIRPHIAAITNITPNHLDRHLSFENYVSAKFNIFKNMTKSDWLILNYDDKNLREINKHQVKSKIVFVSLFNKIDGFFVKNHEVYYKKHKKIKKIVNLYNIKLLGKHNIQNILIAVAVCKILKIKNQNIQKAIDSFEPIKHRLQFVKNVNGVDFVNDSKSTSPDSTITAIKSFDKKTIILILGGSDKNTSFDLLAKRLSKSKNLKYIVVCGATSKKIIKSLKKYGIKTFKETTSFNDAVMLANNLATDGDVVLLSPACASFDFFKCYEERGETFEKIVQSIYSQEE